MTETDKQIRIAMVLPSLGAKDVEDLLSEDRLTVKGEKKLEQEGKDLQHYLFEHPRRGSARFCGAARARRRRGEDDLRQGRADGDLPKAAVAATPVTKVAIGKAGTAKPAARRAAAKPASARGVREKAA